MALGVLTTSCALGPQDRFWGALGGLWGTPGSLCGDHRHAFGRADVETFLKGKFPKMGDTAMMNGILENNNEVSKQELKGQYLCKLSSLIRILTNTKCLPISFELDLN